MSASNPNRVSAEDVDRILPQTQCRQCGFEGCASYAAAIAQEIAPINRCAPGGARGIARLAALTGSEPLPLDPEYGHEVPFAVAHIRAPECIGCGWCVRACPTDAIAGAPKRLHAVLEAHCTGCALCAPACPMDCIDFVEAGRDWTDEDAERARMRHDEVQARRMRRAAEENARLEEKRGLTDQAALAKKNLLADIFARARSKN